MTKTLHQISNFLMDAALHATESGDNSFAGTRLGEPGNGALKCVRSVPLSLRV